MVRMTDLPPTKREAMERYPTPEFDTDAWVGGAPLAQKNVTLISSAGLIRRGDRPVTPRDARYRVIPHHLPAEQILMRHVSVNFDRTGFQRDLNVVLPRDRLDELVASGKIGGVAPEHYSFMGATEAEKLEPAARRLAPKLHAGPGSADQLAGWFWRRTVAGRLLNDLRERSLEHPDLQRRYAAWWLVPDRWSERASVQRMQEIAYAP